MPEMMIDSIRVSLMNYQRVVILKEKDSTKYLPIWVGPTEADAIAVKLQDVDVPRPLTHDLLSTVIQSLGAFLTGIIIWDLTGDTFYAKLLLEMDSTSVEVDCRPSDALALAVRSNVPIYADQSVLDKAGILLDEEGKPMTSEGENQQSGKVDEEELRRMSAFTDFIQTLNMEDMEDLGPSDGTEESEGAEE